MALTENKIKQVHEARYAIRDVVAGVIEVFRGAMMNSDASGNVKLASDAASELFAGISMEYVLQDATALAGDNTPKLLSKGAGVAIKLKMTGVTKAHIGQTVYAVDDETVALASVTTNDVEVGVVVGLAEEADHAYVLI